MDDSLVEIENVVNFERSQYNDEVEELRQQVEETIGKVPNETLLNTMAEKEKIFDALEKLNKTLVSCGEQDPKNVMIRLIDAQKIEINEHLKNTIKPLLDVAEVYWARKEMANVVEQYGRAADVILMIDEVNQYFCQVMNTKPTRGKHSNGKRGLEGDIVEGSSRKSAKMDVETKEDEVSLEVEKNARNAMIEMEERAMRPVSVDYFLYYRYFRNLKSLKYFPRRINDVIDLQNRQGGYHKMLKKLSELINDHFTPQVDQLRIFKNEQKKLFKKWNENSIGMKKILKKIEKSYEPKSSTFLTDKLMNSKNIGSLLMGMSFWPVFENSEQRFENGKHADSIYNHPSKPKIKQCMGICRQKTFKEITNGYEYSTSSQVLQKMCKFLDKLEILRKELFKDFQALIDYFLETSSYDFVEQDDETFNCLHEMNDYWRMCIDEKSRKKEKKGVECRVCVVLHTLNHLRFAIGTGSYHGIVKNRSGREVDSFFSMVFMIERRRNVHFDRGNQLNRFLQYLERLRQTTVHIQTWCDSIIFYSISLDDVGGMSGRNSEEAWLNRDLDEWFIDPHEEGYEENNEKLKTACQELKYLANFYKEKEEIRKVLKSGKEDTDLTVGQIFGITG